MQNLNESQNGKMIASSTKYKGTFLFKTGQTHGFSLHVSRTFLVVAGPSLFSGVCSGRYAGKCYCHLLCI